MVTLSDRVSLLLFFLQSVDITSKLGETILFHKIDGLNPHTEYTFFIQCSLPDCFNNYCWGALTGPVVAMTEEEGWVSIEVIYHFIYLFIFCGVCKRITLVNCVVPETIPTLREWTRIPGGRGVAESKRSKNRPYSLRCFVAPGLQIM